MELSLIDRNLQENFDSGNSGKGKEKGILYQMELLPRVRFTYNNNKALILQIGYQLVTTYD